VISADEFWPKLDALGEEEVRKRLAQQVSGEKKLPLVREWLARKERERQEAAGQEQNERADRADQLSAEANAISREGNAIAGRANLIAWVAIILSIAAIVVSVFCVS